VACRHVPYSNKKKKWNMSSHLKSLVKRLEEDPTNIELMNEVAMGYCQTPEMVTNDEDLKFFQKAYLTKKTVKTTNNLAWQLYMEYGKTEQALKVIKECISLNPKSYFPYNLLGNILMDEEKYEEALHYFKIAESKSDERNIVNNIGVVHFKTDNFEQAHNYFNKGSKLNDIENRSLFNLGLTEFYLRNLTETEVILESLIQNLKNEFLDPVCSYDLASVYVALNLYDKASELTIELGLDGIDLADWPEIAYSLFKTHPKLFDEAIAKSIVELKEWIAELETGHEDWEEYTDLEKIERIEEFTLDIKTRESLKAKFINGKPIKKLDVMSEYCGCLLFGCKMHGNPLNDD
jgi:tetratricopeptide (TPR) repeat protein